MMKYIFFTCISLAAAVPQGWGQFAQDEPKNCNAPRIRGDYCDSAPQRQMFYYNSQQGVCQPFMFNGCNGNGNQFNSARECQEYCINGGGAQVQQDVGISDQEEMKNACRADYDTTQLTVTRCSAGQQCPVGHNCTSGICCPLPDYLCMINYDSGKFAVGGEKSDRYFFTKQYNTCMRFSYYGSLGNANNFPSYNACMRTCGALRA